MSVLRCPLIFLLSLGIVATSGASSVMLRWDPPTTYTDGSPAGPEDIGGYVLHYGTTSQQYPLMVNVGNVTTASLTGLADGTTYYVVATVYDTEGISSGFSAPELVIQPSVSGDTTPPAVQITAPEQGASVPRKATVTLTATATDNVGVTSVAFFVAGTLTCTATVPPYTCLWQVPAPPKRTYTLQAKAYDARANMGTSSPVTVTAR